MECASILMERGDWSSINGDFINESNFMENIFINCSLSDMVGCDNGSYYTTDTTDSNCYSVSQYSQESIYSESSEDIAYQCHENYILSNHDQFFAVNNGNSLPIEFCLNTNGVIQVFPGNFMDRNHSFNNNVDDSETYVTQHENFEVNAKYEMVEIEPVEEVKSNDDLLEVGCKRSRNSEVQKGKRNARSKKSRKLESDELQNSPSLEKQNSGNCSSEELSCASKTRASRGAATDPQSLYARKRRERINEKLRTLQKLVPNGTKVDLSTMLEEAVSYVKFLQLQIKLLSSDELWMYAPLAYNGMDIGLDSKLNSLLQ